MTLRLKLQRGRLDSDAGKTATEIERYTRNIPKAVKQLKDSNRERRVLLVPQNLTAKAV